MAINKYIGVKNGLGNEGVLLRLVAKGILGSQGLFPGFPYSTARANFTFRAHFK